MCVLVDCVWVCDVRVGGLSTVLPFSVDVGRVYGMLGMW
jgi:hypothetical protein